MSNQVIQRFFKRFIQPIWFTLFGTLIVPPFRTVSLTTSLTLPDVDFAALLIFLGVFFAAVAAFLALAGAFLAAALALVVVFLAAALVFVAVFLAAVFTLVAAFAAAIALLATAALKPAFCRDAVDDFANLATLSTLADTNFFADAALTLGSADKLLVFESVPLAAMLSPILMENGAPTSIL